MTYKLTNCLIFQINLSLYLPDHIKMSPSPVIYKKTFNCWYLGKRTLISQISNMVVHDYIPLCNCSRCDNFSFCPPCAIFPHFLLPQIVSSIHKLIQKDVQVIIMYFYKVTYRLPYLNVIDFCSCQDEGQCPKITVTITPYYEYFIWWFQPPCCATHSIIWHLSHYTIHVHQAEIWGNVSSCTVCYREK